MGKWQQCQDSHVDFMKINRPTFLCSQLWNKNFIVLNLLNLSNKQTFLWAYFQLRNGDRIQVWLTVLALSKCS